jgi:hypothetical protein
VLSQTQFFFSWRAICDVLDPVRRAQRHLAPFPSDMDDLQAVFDMLDRLVARPSSHLTPSEPFSSPKSLMPATAAQFVASPSTRDQFSMLTNGGRLPEHSRSKHNEFEHDTRDDHVEDEVSVPLYALRAYVEQLSAENHDRFFNQTLPGMIAMIVLLGPKIFTQPMYGFVFLFSKALYLGNVE